MQAASRAEQLEIAASREAAIKESAVFKKDQLVKPGSGYTVNSTTGVVRFHGDKIHGDADLRGVFAQPARAEDAPQRIDYRSGDNKGAEEGPASVRRGEMNSQLNPGGRQIQDPIQHGGEVDSAVHRNDPQPPIMAFTSQGRVVLKDKAALKKFYLERGLSWPPA